MKLISCYDTFSGCAWYRATVPAFEAYRHGHLVGVHQGGVPANGVRACDVLMVQRLMQPAALDAVRYANSIGKMTVYDLDDDLWCIGPDNSSSDFWQANAGHAVEVLRECKRVTTTTESLARTLRDFHPDVRVIPNYLPDEYWPAPERKRASVPVVGWAGSNSHKADVALVADLLDEFTDDAIVAMAGVGDGWLPPLTRIQTRYTVPIEAYASLLSGFDIGIAPLVDDRFNRAKSDLKVLEYAAVGIPVIASPRYADTPARIAHNAKDWRRHLRQLIADPDTRAEEGAAMREWAEGRMISRHIGEWLDAWTP